MALKRIASIRPLRPQRFDRSAQLAEERQSWRIQRRDGRLYTVAQNRVEIADGFDRAAGLRRRPCDQMKDFQTGLARNFGLTIPPFGPHAGDGHSPFGRSGEYNNHELRFIVFLTYRR